MEKQTRELWHSLALHRWGKWLWLWAALVGLATAPLRAQAHAQVVRSSPADHAHLSGSPRQLEVWFSELLEDGFNSAQVFSAHAQPATPRTNLVQGQPRVDAKDRTHLMVNVQPMPPGDYVFEWRVLSRDGHSAPGKINFRVLAPNESAMQSTPHKPAWNTPHSTPSN